MQHTGSCTPNWVPHSKDNSEKLNPPPLLGFFWETESLNKYIFKCHHIGHMHSGFPTKVRILPHRFICWHHDPHVYCLRSQFKTLEFCHPMRRSPLLWTGVLLCSSPAPLYNCSILSSCCSLCYKFMRQFWCVQTFAADVENFQQSGKLGCLWLGGLHTCIWLQSSNM
jgi:hypothetical protein